MEGDPRNQKASLLKKYDLNIEDLSYEYVENCTNKKTLEKIIRVLRSGEEGSYPHLLKVTEERLKLFAPDSRVLRVETPILTKECLTKEEWDTVEKELLSWEKEMNVMDKSLDFEKNRIEVVGNKNMPEVRKVTQLPAKTKPEKKSKAITDKNNLRIKSGDYSAWDKFDVDKELLKMDVEEERKQEENEKKKREAKKVEKEKKIEVVDVDKENYSSMEQQVLANQAKDRGNECYKSGDLESALKYYEISIKLHPTANAYNNRAMTYLKLKQYENALKACNTALNLEKNNVKALYRRATAYQNMPGKKDNDHYDELALKDLYQIITLEPNNKAAQTDLQRLKKKLNIEDPGKKFRMPISEGFTNKKNSNPSEGKNSTSNTIDNIVSTERLPLTYYGPSTSTFQCEPYSMVHRALLGSSISGQVLCKCNSNRPRQNPLCQRCGEAMSTPKPRKVLNTNQVTKKENETKNQILEQQKNKNVNVDNKSSNSSSDDPAKKNKTANDLKNNSLVKSHSIEEIQNDNESKETKTLVAQNKKSSDDDNKNEFRKNNSTVDLSKESVDLTEDSLNRSKVALSDSKGDANFETINKRIVETQVGKTVSHQSKSLNNEMVATVEPITSKNSETNITESISSQGDVGRSSKKTKNRKKKSKEPKENKIVTQHLEPMKVVHAAKYLHPTSVEPKIKNESSGEQQRELNPPTNNIQYKAFVPNKMYYSTECQRIGSPSPKTSFSAPDDKPSSKLSYEESNKENILENGAQEGNTDEIKKEVVESPFEFIKTWEELRNYDESYIKRAEIIRKIKPCDLSKVIGIKLDSDMLSCFLECMVRHFVETDPKRVVELLKQLPQVPRFGLVSMFLADTDKKKIKKLVEIAEDKGFKLEEEVKRNLTILS